MEDLSIILFLILLIIIYIKKQSPILQMSD